MISLEHLPKNVAWPVTVPVSLFANNFLYASNDVNLIAILGTMPVKTAPNPLYRPRGVSRLTISTPVVIKPLFFAYAEVNGIGTLKRLETNLLLAHVLCEITAFAP